jgi:hypothetical protein
MTRLIVALAVLLASGVAHAQLMFPARLRYDPTVPPPAFDLITGRHVSHTGEYHATFPERRRAVRARLAPTIAALDAWLAAPDPSTTMLGAPSTLPTGGPAWEAMWQRLGELVVFAERRDAEVYRVMGHLQELAGKGELAWYAYQRALELGHPGGPALQQRIEAIEGAWRQAARKDAPTLGSYRFVRAGADRWRAAYEQAEREAVMGKEDPDSPTVMERLILQADIEVPQTILGADSFMRRWGVALLVGGVALVFWTLYLVAALRKRRRPQPAG